MRRINKQHLPEQIIYLVIWLIVFLVPVVGHYYTAIGTGSAFNWSAIRVTWLIMLPFLLLFVANNYFLAPCLLFRKKYRAYVLFTLGAIVLLFGVCPYLVHPSDPFRQRERLLMERKMPQGHPMMQHHMQEQPRRWGDSVTPPRPFPLPGPTFVCMAMAILLVGFNIAIKLMFKSLRDEHTLKELEHERLQSELEYLKYQINPHFFMNTLNNIHALVDIDSTKAKKALVELSKLMRYVLYETSNKTILLSREIQFLNNYIELMKLRYTDKVDIQVVFPEEVPEVQIPPLLFISFIENAFKHGVSYQKDSFIHVLTELDRDKILFRCSNSNRQKEGEAHHGIGLDNIRKRLRLLFGNDYTLSIDETDDCFNVLLIIPFL
ncbi:sensor histidine kinase [Bacteroides sp.]